MRTRAQSLPKSTWNQKRGSFSNRTYRKELKKFKQQDFRPSRMRRSKSCSLFKDRHRKAIGEEGKEMKKEKKKKKKKRTYGTTGATALAGTAEAGSALGAGAVMHIGDLFIL
ncbi:hypothetical protein BKA67DRAFT_532007 [Truncatella angustata]|uniref:Uncharacterized protein n=1 Tax=Truncatella angustata TaxID=152316 RepID=A0A9P8UPW4_9PEZI|nr:uncharacterized protein BKA67DRAFT_532007 [Truncatella angustata]KAH6656755.1 hypothetical protein BKA67DRAFT_532007 [Truncatella angustata]